MGPRWEDETARKISFGIKWHVSGDITLVKLFLVWWILTDMLGDGLMVLRVCMEEMEVMKEE